jgi:glycerol-3-phosphate acyltransferase PlsY
MLVFMPLLAYLLGSFPTAFILTKILRGRDIREMGDGNMGTQNVFHQVSPATGIAVGLTDAFKGALIVIPAKVLGLPQSIILLSSVATVVGHNWPVYLKFRGGRGEATTIGVLLILMTWPMLISCVLGLMTLLKTKNVTLSSAPLFIFLPLLCWLFNTPAELIIFSIVLPSLVGFTHFLRVYTPKLWREA